MKRYPCQKMISNNSEIQQATKWPVVKKITGRFKRSDYELQSHKRERQVKSGVSLSLAFVVTV